MALDFSALRKPVSPQVVDPQTGRMREEWQLYFDQLTSRLNGAVGELAVDPGDVFGPSSATDNALVRFDGTTGKLIQDSAATLDDSGNLLTTGTIRSTHNGTGGGSLILNGAGNIGIELGRVDGSSSTPYLDMHSGATAVDYDVRLIASGGTGSNGGGLLTIQAAAGVSFGTTAPLTAGTIELGAVSDTTLARATAGFATIEGKEIVSPASAASGDIIYYDGTHWVRLAKQTDGQFLTLASGLPAWANNRPLVLSTEQATTSGTAFDFSAPFANPTRITVIFNEVSLSGTEDILVQIGDAGGIETTGYLATSGVPGGTEDSTAGFIVKLTTASRLVSGVMTLARVNALTWINGHSGRIANGLNLSGGGSKALSDTLTTVRITRESANTFDAGSVNVLWE